MEIEGVVIELKVNEKGFLNPLMFLKKVDQKELRNVVDFRLLNAYSRT